MTAVPWRTIPSGTFALEMAGPGIDDLAHAVAEQLADSVYLQDGRSDVWGDYLVARHNLCAARQYGTEVADIDALEAAAAHAWDKLSPELASTVRLHYSEARLVAELLDESAGRIGQVAA